MEQTPTPPEPPVGAVQPSPEPAAPTPVKNTIGLVALIVAAVGFIFACIPGALIVGWILLPVSFVLAIVSLAQKGKKKGTGIAALILAVVGTIVGVIVFVVVAASAVSDSLDQESGSDETTVVDDHEAAPEADDVAQDDPADEPAEEPAAQEPEPSGPEGTRADPLPFDAQIETDDWVVRFTSFDSDANAEVAAANMFNDEPTAGTQWIIVEAEATYTGDDSSNTFDLTFDYVSADGTVIATHDSFAASLEPEFDGFAELFTGGTEAGKIAFLVPDSVDGLLRVTPSLFGDDVFFALP